MSQHTVIAAVDLGSNSFRLEIARVLGDQIYPLDTLKETVRLAAGLREDKTLDEAAQARALACLKRFNERLRGLSPEAVRAVGTNTFRVAKNAKAFLSAAEQALGFPIEVVAGKEEARLIYLGVSHSLPPSSAVRLVVDIGGGSTECIIGEGYEPKQMESLYMGCVSFSRRFFADGRLSKAAMKAAELAARAEVQAIAADFGAAHWQQAVGSSGTVRALADICRENGLTDGAITAEALDAIRAMLIEAREVKKLKLRGLSADRVAVIAGGFAILAAVFRELGIARMEAASGALREGILYDMLGRFHHHDARELTVEEFLRRYHVDRHQAERVASTAERLLAGVAACFHLEPEAAKYLEWAARLHEIGISIAHSGYHRHSAYILANADMPGFSRKEQERLALLARAHRGSLAKVAPMVSAPEDWLLIGVLRLAVLFNRSRSDLPLPALALEWRARGFRLRVDRQWLADNPLTEMLLHKEEEEWRSVGVRLDVAGAR
ncbi:exopolyphosphatase [Thiobacter aerophilum]|uniref:Exopolyphosphatase n=1 Tax=Thiobacter aerophilum TaxID=3121275 RepID=A0ABV0EH40_9BURK